MTGPAGSARRASCRRRGRRDMLMDNGCYPLARIRTRPAPIDLPTAVTAAAAPSRAVVAPIIAPTVEKARSPSLISSTRRADKHPNTSTHAARLRSLERRQLPGAPVRSPSQVSSCWLDICSARNARTASRRLVSCADATFTAVFSALCARLRTCALRSAHRRGGRRACRRRSSRPVFHRKCPCRQGPAHNGPRL
jgi:hypothetical protein